MPQVRLLWLWLAEENLEATIRARPGQFFMLRCGAGLEMPLRRPLSIHQTAPLGFLAFLYKTVGKGTRWLASREARQTLDILGPLGNGFTIPQGARNLLLVAGGMGIAPLVCLAEKALTAGHPVTLLLGAAGRKGVYPARFLPPGARVVVATEDGSVGQQGLVTDLLPEFAPEADQVFACGPVSMYKTMAGQACLSGKPVQVSLEARLGCGVGACYACSIKTKTGMKQVCRDGPVFELSDIEWSGFHT